MKITDYLKTSLAIVGGISLFILACSADDSDNSENNPNMATGIGKYQITDIGQSTYGDFHVIDTETGIVKTFERPTATGNFVLTKTTITQ
jgi:uncharacterized protein involved in high-affinity Fe2+ transport